MGHDGFAGRGREHIVAKADDASRGNLEFDVDAVVARLHGEDVTLAARHHVDHFRAVFLGDIDAQRLNRLAFLAVDLLDDHLRLTDLKLIPLAAHGLDEDREMEHASAEDYPLVFALPFPDSQGEVFVELALETLLNMARGDIFAILAEEGGIVDGEEH